MYFVVAVLKMLFPFAFSRTVVSRTDRNSSGDTQSCLGIRLVISTLALFSICVNPLCNLEKGRYP